MAGKLKIHPIPRVDGVEVYVNDGGRISIKQEQEFDGEQIVAITREQVETVIGFLQQAAAEYDANKDEIQADLLAEQEAEDARQEEKEAKKLASKEMNS